MTRIYQSARGESVDVDAIYIKQQLALVPMEISVARRKNFIDSKEEKPSQRQAFLPDLGSFDNTIVAPDVTPEEVVTPVTTTKGKAK